MQTVGKVTILGTSHIAKQSVEEIRAAFERIQPDIVAVELDRDRANALLSSRMGRPSIRDIRTVGVKGFLFALLGSWASRKLGKMVGMVPGAEMKMALMLARKHSRKVALIDQHIQVTLRRFSQTLTWKERWRFLADAFNGLVLRKKDPLLNFDLKKVPEKKLISLMVERVRERYPNIYTVLIEERNRYMAKQLEKLMARPHTILAVVGAGHEEEIARLLRETPDVSYGWSYTVEN